MRFRVKSRNLTVHAVAGTHVVILGMNAPDEARKGLLGFAIQRTDHTEGETYWLQGMRTFKVTNPNPPDGVYFSTAENPIQDFLWSDFTAKTRHDYTYYVVGMRGTPKNYTLDAGTSVSIKVTTESDAAASQSVYFNRGVIGSQAYTRQFGDNNPQKFVGSEKAKAYAWLSRGLEEAMLAFIQQADNPRYALRAAVYEFGWDPVSAAFGDALRACKDVRIIYDARVPGGTKELENKKRVTEAQNQFKKHKLTGKTAAGEDVTVPRTENPSYIAHNKFIVLLDGGDPVQVWTGSTNFTESGIFGQSNVGHVVRDRAVAAKYHAYWQALSGDPAQKEIVASDELATPTLHKFPPPAGITPLFSPRADLAQLNWYATALENSTVLDCFTAAFGVNKVFFDVFTKPKKYLRYLFLEEWAVKKAAVVATQKALQKDPLVQVAVGATMRDGAVAGWAKELFNPLSAHVHYTHNKFALVDPLSDDPIVISGSANFSDASTQHNDENMLVVRGDTRVADIYLGEFMRMWRHHRFREIVSKNSAKGGAVEHNYLTPDDSWTDPFYRAGTVKYVQRETFA
jgi:phosphatidylserine/phosphatidylglycerophosphate/cardiolipin synthase-like enzyme